MVAGYLRAKDGYWHMVVSFKDEYGKRRFRSKSTRLPVNGNKRRAEEMLVDYRRYWTRKLLINSHSGGVYFTDYLDDWLERIRYSVAPTTYHGYVGAIHRYVFPYFEPKGLSLTQITPTHIAGFYEYLLAKPLSPNTVRHIHANLHKAFDRAVLDELIDYNPADRVKPPRTEKYEALFYSADECRTLLKATEGSAIETAVKLTLFLGLRRSEVLGLQWDAVDFENHTIQIIRSMRQIGTVIIESNTLKRKSSYRTLPMPDEIEELLLKLPRVSSHICVDATGRPLSPDALSSGFRSLLKSKGLRKIRFHDLRHTCAALLLANRVPIYEVSKWMGHSTLAITYDLYGHIEFQNKLNCASALTEALKGE